MPQRPSYARTSSNGRPSKGRSSSNGRPSSNGNGRRSHPARRPKHVAPSAPPSRVSELERALDATTTSVPADLPATFAASALPTPLVDELTRAGMTTPFPIQARTIKDALAGRDVLGRAQTGSGKTLAFGLPLLAHVAAEQRPVPGRPRALVLVPTRELAQQVTDTLAPLGRVVGVRIAAVYGGASMGRQITLLRRGAGVVVATPGRLIDLIEQGECRLDEVTVTVLDEADYMADLGFLPAVTQLLDLTATGGQRLLFSATLDRGVDTLVHRFLTDPAMHAVAEAAAPIESVDHRVFSLRPEHKVPVAAEIAARPGRSLFFVRTKHGADRLAKQLRRTGVEASAIHGNLTQAGRARALAGFAAGSPRVLVATDVAARGIHVDDVDLVVHFDPPADHKDYLHRSGRTARAGATGTVVSLVHPEQQRDMSRLQRNAHVEAEFVTVEPGHEAVSEIATSGTPVVVREVPTTARPPRRDPRSGNRSGRRPYRGGDRRSAPRS
ncbi:MAG: DEAD/DEAH box helicase [Streptosporangiales bacterium]|nr:DEAD/DEAH box helicase [Streptosporangiales bacterium]